MKISREARIKYKLDEFDFNSRGNIDLEEGIYAVRLLVQKLNNNKDLINYPELALKIGQFNGMTLIFEINNFLLKLYKEETNEKDLNHELYNHLEKHIGSERLYDATKKLINEFPPQHIYKNKIELENFLDGKNEIVFVEEYISLWLGNINPSFSSYLELFSDDPLEKDTAYIEIINEISSFFERKPTFGNKNQNLIDFLKEPFNQYPHSIKKQLEFMHDEWGTYLSTYIMKILIALDLIKEEEMMRGLGPGESRVIEYDILDENYTPDKEWMPKVVMIAKNIYVWLDQLSKKYKRSITKLHDIPDEELNQLSDWGFNSLWLIGLWERCQASKTIKRWCGNPEAEASAYSLFDYEIAYDLGGDNSYQNLKDRAWARGIRLASDMVPNHTGIVSKWTMEHPDWYVSLPYPPFPSYTYSGDSLSGDSNVGIYLEDKYFNRSDAAVTFKRVDHRNGDTRYIYHGNDGTSFPWNDTAQLNFLNPEVSEAVIQTILHVSRQFSIIRFDAAMTLTKKHFQRLWFPEPGSGGAIPSRAEHGISKEDFVKAMPKEFWREVVERINKENPDTLLLAEAFWLLEGFFVRHLGMHRVYNSAFMNMLSDEDNAKYRAVMKNTLEFDPKILKRFVNFMNNPDEETAVKQFGDGDKYFGVCVMLITMPGLPMFGHGQIEGFHEKYGMEYRKAYWDEKINEGLLQHHERTIFPIMRKRYLFAEVENFLLYDFWTGNYVNEDVYTYSNRINQERALVVYHNKYAETKGYIKTSVGFAVKSGEDTITIQKTLAEGLNLPLEGYCMFKDYMTGLEYIRRNRDIHEKGLYIELRAFQSFVFMDFQIFEKDDKFFHYAQLYDLLNGKGVYDIRDTLNKVIFEPLHTPFQNLLNETNFKEFLELKNKDKTIKSTIKELTNFLNEIKNYSSGKNDINDVKEEIIEKLEIFFNLGEYSKALGLSEEDKKYFDEIIPKSEYDMCIFLSWLFTHLIGKIKSKKNYELMSRSWIDEWQLSKCISSTLDNITTAKSKKSWETSSLIKILINLQNLYENAINDELSQYTIIKDVFSDTQIQQFLNVNRYQDILWFDGDAFFLLCDWFAFITILNKHVAIKQNQKESIVPILTILKNLKRFARKAEYKINNLLLLLRDTN